MSGLERLHRIPLHNHADNNSGGRIDAGQIVAAVGGSGSSGGGTSVIPLVESLPTAETDTSLVLHPDGTGGVEWGVDTAAGLVLSGTLSAPPTEAEIEALVGAAPVDTIGVRYLIEDTASGRWYSATSDGVDYQFVPTVGPTEPAATAITSGAAGGWTQITNERAVSGGNGYTYVGYVRGNNGDVAVRSIDEATGTAGTERVLHAAFEVDIHDAPCLLIRASDSKLLCFYTKHLGTGVFMRVSTNAVTSDPTLSGGFAAEVNLDSSLGGTHYTYPNAFQLLGETGDPIYLIYRDHQSSDTVVAWCYSTSTDGGSTWSAQTAFLRGVGSKAPYLTFSTDDDTRIDIAASDGHPVDDAPTAVYHLYWEAGNFHKSGGTTISASQPFNASDGTLVYSDGSQSGWPVNITNADGSPTFMIQVLLSGGTDCSNRYARWSGTAWTVTAVVNSGGLGIDSVVGDQAIVDRAAPAIVYAAVITSGKYEVREYHTLDGGATFTLIRNLTSASASDNIHPVSVKNYSPALRLLWLYGTYTTYLSWSLSIRGLFGATADGSTVQLSRLVSMTGTKADVEAMAGTIDEVIVGRATDTAEIGVSEDGATWEWYGGGVSALDDLTDVTITTPAEGDFLRYDGAAWVNAVLTVDDFPFHDEPLTDGASNFIFDGGDVVTVVGIPN